MKAGDGGAVFLVGGNQLAFACNGLRIVKGLALHAGGVAIAAFQDAQLVAAATHIHNAGNAGGKVGGIVLKSAGGKGCFKAVTREQVIPHVAVNGIRLVTVGHNGGIVQGQNRVIDDQVGIFQLGGVCGYRADAAGDGVKHAVAAVGAAAHDPVGDERLLAVGAFAQHNATPGVVIPGKIFVDVFFHNDLVLVYTKT